MTQLTLLVAMAATTGLFGRPAATCQGGSCGSAAYYSPYYQPTYSYPQPAGYTYQSHYYAAQPQPAVAQPQPTQALRSVPAAAPAAAVVAQPQPAAAVAQPAQAPAYYYYYPAASPCAGGNCYRR